MLVWDRSSPDASVLGFVPSGRMVDRLARRTRQRRIVSELSVARRSDLAGRDLFSDDRTQFGAEVARQLPPCDVVHLHWVAGFVDYRLFLSRLPPGVPVVWTLHDMNTFTGGCHYDKGCGRFVEMCGACPQLGSGAEEDLSRRIWRRKRDALSELGDRPVHIVADSDWMAGEARRSSLLGGFPTSTIYYGLDTEVFAPRGRAAAREVLGLPMEASVVLFVADSVEDRRKGLAHLVEALEGMRGFPDLLLVSIGGGEPALRGGLPHRHLGSVSDDRLLAIVYSAADVFVIPSLQEAFGQTALESIACGTPAVGFDAGGIPEVVRPGVTGLLAPAGDSIALREAIVRILGDRDEAARLAASGRRVAVTEHGLSVQAERYVALYRELIGAERDPG